MSTLLELIVFTF